jgi:hypothetical protein
LHQFLLKEEESILSKSSFRLIPPTYYLSAAELSLGLMKLSSIAQISLGLDFGAAVKDTQASVASIVETLRARGFGEVWVNP